MLKVALIGCGRWGLNHLSVLSAMRDKGLIGHITVVDPSNEARSAAELADETTVSIQGLQFDFVILATPSNMHSQQARDLLSEGNHVLVEKPLGNCETEAANVIATAREHGRILGVGLLLRFHPAIIMANQMLNNGELGRIETLRFVRRTQRSAPPGGDVIESLGVHAIDLMCHLMSESEPNNVSVEGDNLDSRIALEFPHGIEAIIDVAWGASKERRNIQITGSSGSLRIDLGIHDRAFLISDGKEKEIFCESSCSPLEAELMHMVRNVKRFNENKSWTPVPDYGAALRGVRWTERAKQNRFLSRPH